MEKRSDFEILTENCTLKRPLRTAKRRWEDNILMEFKEISINKRDLVDTAHYRDHWRALVNAASNLRVP